MSERTIGSIILAAGSSSRLGSPKQLLEYNGATFIENAVKACLESGCKPIVVVLGANSERIIPFLEDYPVEVVFNENWQEGMGSSIVKGLDLINNNLIEASIIMVCDQPYVSSDHLSKLIQVYTSTGKNIVATSYDNTIGVPVLFDQQYFKALRQLKGNDGAKKILPEYSEDLSTVNFQKASIDIDTIEDYNKLEK